MKIKAITRQHRRDFTAVMKCEFCEHEEINDCGYDDDYYHRNVIPEMKCGNCGKSTISEKGKIDNTKTKYPKDLQV